MLAIASLVRAAATLPQLMRCLMSGRTCCVVCIRCVRILHELSIATSVFGHTSMPRMQRDTDIALQAQS